MINLKKRLIFVFLVLLILISGCKGKKDVKKALEEIRTGTEGITITFLPNTPPDKIHIDRSSTTFDVVLELKNKGAYPQPEDRRAAPQGKVFLSGFDTKIIKIELTEKDREKSGDLGKMALEGKSTLNPNGGMDLLSFTGTVDFNKLNVEKYEPTLLATACYYYETIAGPSVCIDPNPYEITKEKKVCEVQDITLSNQGAPIAITKIDEEALASRTRFKITIKNVGGGDVMKEGAAKNKCDPYGGTKVEREDIDKVFLKSVKISDKSLICGPFADTQSGFRTSDGGYVRIINGEGFVICELPNTDYSNKRSAYTTPLLIHLTYGYRNIAEKKIQIKKETVGGGSDSSGVVGTAEDSETTRQAYI